MPRVAKEDAASLVAWSMICKLDVVPSGRSRLSQLGVGHSAVTEDLAWADDPNDPAPRRRSWFLRRSHVEAVETLYRISPGKLAPPHRWIKAELLSLAPISVYDHLQEQSFRPSRVTWPFTWWQQLKATDPGAREEVLIRTMMLADELERAAWLDERSYNLELLHRDAASVGRLVELLLTVVSGPPLSARPAVRELGRLCCHSPQAWTLLQQHLRNHPLGHLAYLAFARMLRQPPTPRERAAEISTWLINSPDELAVRGMMDQRCWNVQGLFAQALGLLPTTQRVTEKGTAPRVHRIEAPSERDVDYTRTVLPSGLWPPDQLVGVEELLRQRTAVVVATLREQARDWAARRHVREEPPPDLVSERLGAQAVNPQLSWRVRALAADGLRTHRSTSQRIVSGRPSGSRSRAATSRTAGGVPRRVDRTYRGSMDEVLVRLEKDVKAGLDPSGGLAHAVAVFGALERVELTRPGRPPARAVDESGHVLDDEQLRRSPAVSQVLERILDDVIPDSPPPRSRDAEARHRAAFTEAVRHLVDGLDPWFDLQGEHAVPPAARRGVRTLIRTMLGSLDIGRERRAVSTLVAAGMAVPTMCVLNRLLRADLDGHLEARRSSFLTELSLLHLGHLAENPLAGVAVLRWLDRRWSEWREELRSTPLLPPSAYQQGDEHLLWPTGEDLGAYLQSRHRLELIHTAVWALGDIKWDALADEEAREWLGERWKRGVVLLHDVATYGLTESEKGGYGEPAAGVFPTALSAVRQSAYYALAVTRWDEPQPGDSPARLEAIPVVGAVRQWYSHEDGQPVPHAHAIPGDARWPAEIAQHAVDIVDQLKHNGERPIVLEGLRAWRADYRKLVYPGPHQ